MDGCAVGKEAAVADKEKALLTGYFSPELCCSVSSCGQIISQTKAQCSQSMGKPREGQNCYSCPDLFPLNRPLGYFSSSETKPQAMLCHQTGDKAWLTERESMVTTEMQFSSKKLEYKDSRGSPS